MRRPQDVMFNVLRASVENIPKTLVGNVPWLYITSKGRNLVTSSGRNFADWVISFLKSLIKFTGNSFYQFFFWLKVQRQKKYATNIFLYILLRSAEHLLRKNEYSFFWSVYFQVIYGSEKTRIWSHYTLFLCNLILSPFLL